MPTWYWSNGFMTGLLWHQEHGATVDHDDVAGVVRGGVAREVRGDALEVARFAPAAGGESLLDRLVEREHLLGSTAVHLGVEPARAHHVGPDAEVSVLERDAAHHRLHRGLRGAVVRDHRLAAELGEAPAQQE